MKTQKETFVEMLKLAGVPHEDKGNIVMVENLKSGYSGFGSTWVFNDKGELIDVGHYES